MDLGTSNISDLPINSQTSIQTLPNVIDTNSKNTVVNTPNNYNEIMNQCMNEVSNHDVNPVMNLPSRDIPQDPSTINNDLETIPDYVPKKSKDIIGDVKRVRFQEPSKELESEMVLSLIASTLFLLFQLPYFKNFYLKCMKKGFSKLVKSDGNVNLIGNILYSIIFGAVLYGIIVSIDYSSFKLAF